MSARGRKLAAPVEVEAYADAEVRLGRWQDVLADVRPDVVISDPPYGERTHSGDVTATVASTDGAHRLAIDYDRWTPADVDTFVSSWAPRTACWIVVMTSHDLIPAWESSFAAADWYAFAPLTALISGMGVRQLGDGPASWSVHIMAARRRAKRLSALADDKIWRSLPGGYTGPSAPTMAGGRGKPSWLLDALVRDYSDPGMTIVDPCAGWGSTLVAARNAGRRAIGSEMDPGAFARAQAAIAGDMTAYARLAPHREREADPMRPGLFDSLGGAA